MEKAVTKLSYLITMAFGFILGAWWGGRRRSYIDEKTN
jgi:hypothetical protein